MSKPSIASADKISAEDFRALLDRYPQCVNAISESKGAKNGQKTLAELDSFRYGEATRTFGDQESLSKSPMNLDDVKTLVEWKLRHGKFRPTLMKLVSSNAPSDVLDTVSRGVRCYRDTGDASAALAILTKLRGIGPATASLLLAVHAPERVVFFADEAFWWLCCGGKKDAIRYDAKEYKDLNARAAAVAERLDVRAVDVERVAFVIMREGGGAAEPARDSKPKDSKPKAEKKKAVPERAVSKATADTPKKTQDVVADAKNRSTKKRAEPADESERTEPLRRSKRGKGI